MQHSKSWLGSHRSKLYTSLIASIHLHIIALLSLASCARMNRMPPLMAAERRKPSPVNKPQLPSRPRERSGKHLCYNGRSDTFERSSCSMQLCSAARHLLTRIVPSSDLLQRLHSFRLETATTAGFPAFPVTSWNFLPTTSRQRQSCRRGKRGRALAASHCMR